MTKAKTKTVKVRVAVVYDGKRDYQAGGCDHAGWKQPDDYALIADTYDSAPEHRKAYPYTCIVEIELPISEPLKVKVLKVLNVKQVKP